MKWSSCEIFSIPSYLSKWRWTGSDEIGISQSFCALCWNFSYRRYLMWPSYYLEKTRKIFCILGDEYTLWTLPIFCIHLSDKYLPDSVKRYICQKISLVFHSIFTLNFHILALSENWPFFLSSRLQTGVQKDGCSSVPNSCSGHAQNLLSLNCNLPFFKPNWGSEENLLISSDCPNGPL